MKFIFTIFISFLFSFAFGQTDKSKIIKTFDKFVYYPDSTIKAAYKTKGRKYHGYSIEFNEMGQANYIGRYWKGKKWSWWIKPDNTTDYYQDDMNIYYLGMKPTCGYGQPHNFEILYSDILDGKTK